MSRLGATGTGTRAGVIAFGVDAVSVGIGLAAALKLGTITAGALPVSYLLALQAASILAFLLLNGGYRDPAKIHVSRNLYLTALAATLSTAIATSPQLVLATDFGPRQAMGLGLHVFLAWFPLFAGRALFGRAVHRYRDRLATRATIIVLGGAGHSGRQLVTGLRAAAANGLAPTEFFDTRTADEDGLRDALQRARKPHVKDIVFALPWENRTLLRKAINLAAEYAVNVHVFPDKPEMYLNNPVQIVGGIPVVTVAVRPLTPLQDLLKRGFDIAASLAIIALTMPLLALIALAIKIDSKGPVLFRQVRHGYNNQTFEILKFRSMTTIVHDGPLIQVTRNDRRVTRVGKILRRLSLDELPQVFNVFHGDMSLIGPRPHAVSHHLQYCDAIEGYRHRHRVRPGITGWAQVRGFRGETDTPEKMAGRVNLDLEYIENWSLGLDIKILLMTFFVGFYHRNAY